MVAMTAAVVLGVIALMVAIVAWLTWRRGADERQSVQHHQHTLETLRNVADRQPPSALSSPTRRRPVAKIQPTSAPTGSGAPGHRGDDAATRSPKRAPSSKRSTSPRADAAPPSFRHVG